MAGLGSRCVDLSSDVDAERRPQSWFDQLETPRCTTTVVSGKFVHDTLRPADCFYSHYSSHELFSSLQDTWVVVSGGSNAILMAMWLMNTLELDSDLHLDPAADGVRTFDTDIIDIVWDKDRERVHYFNKRWKSILFRDTDGSWGSQEFNALNSVLGQNIPSGAVRITLCIGQYWNNLEKVFQAVDAGASVVDSPWGSKKKLFLGQIQQWYLVCGVYNLFFCNNNALRGIGMSRTLDAYEDEMKQAMKTIETRCASDDWDCFLTNNCYDSSQIGLVTPLNDIFKRTLAQSTSVHMFDYFKLGSMLPGEIGAAHGSPKLMAWTWFMLLTVARPKIAAVGKPNPVVFDESCGMQTVHQSCPGCACSRYRAACGMRCDDWECANARRCTSKIPMNYKDTAALAPVSADYSGALSQVGVVQKNETGRGTNAGCSENSLYNFSALAPEYSGPSELMDPCFRRLWCSESNNGMLLALVCFVCAFAYFGCKALSRRRPDEPMNKNDASQGVELTTTTKSKEEDTKSTSASSERRERLTSLGGARLFASCHIVLGHLYQSGAVKSVYFFPGALRGCLGFLCCLDTFFATPS